ncbi:hypothetical protein [Pedobacter sp. SL55]|uniref:hypothetical protein n=1 Tax=Pedobacter sp. SL55 TaxID=2995161 RepID=UPI00226EBF58|nr:hypothetical protein [Pedobacter sp. SL55]WAC42559.1 hypothetical protein OVA16_09455 [Pedobacter sp. SL55]
MEKFWTKALLFSLGLFVLYCVSLVFLFNSPRSIPYLTDLANHYMFWAYYINMFLLFIGIMVFIVRLLKKLEHKNFLAWLSFNLIVIIIQWLFLALLGGSMG